MKSTFKEITAARENDEFLMNLSSGQNSSEFNEASSLHNGEPEPETQELQLGEDFHNPDYD